MALNWKSLAAIALLVIVVTPIGLGYLMASDTHEKTTYETSSSHNLSDYILNYQAPYYGEYSGSTNNHSIITEYLNQGAWTETINSPQYSVVSENQSSLPIETWTDHTYSVETGYIDFTESDTWTVGYYDDPMPTHLVYWRPAWVLTTPSIVGWELTLYDFDRQVIYRGVPTTPISGSLSFPDQRLTVTFSDYQGDYSYDVKGWVVAAQGGLTLRWSYTNYNALNIDEDEYLASGLLYAGVTKDGYDPFYQMWSSSYIYVTEDTISIAGTDYPRSEYTPLVVPPLGSTYIVYRTSSLSGNYGDPASGWTLPDVGTPQSRVDYWTNNQVNRGVTLYANLDNNEWMGLMPTDAVTTSTDAALRIYRVDGVVYVDQDYGTTAVKLGAYSNVQIKITKDAYTVTGIKSWPAMYAPVAALNSVTVDRAPDTFTMLKLLQYNGSQIYFRVDAADIHMGEYSTTLNATLNLSQIFPDKTMALSMNSVAVFGDSLSVGGTQSDPYNIPVDNGKITVSGQTFPLRGSLWMWTLVDGFYSLTINGYHVQDATDHLAAAALNYVGEWSTIITGYTVTPVTGVVTEWVPGAFAFNQNSMAAAAMIAAVGAFIVLGLTGRSSLPKAGILALVCGGAVAVFLMLT